MLAAKSVFILLIVIYSRRSARFDKEEVWRVLFAKKVGTRIAPNVIQKDHIFRDTGCRT